jgi:hypothetical protein
MRPAWCEQNWTADSENFTYGSNFFFPGILSMNRNRFNLDRRLLLDQVILNAGTTRRVIVGSVIR